MRGAAALLLGLLSACSAGDRERSAYAIDLTDTGLFAPATLRLAPGASVTFHNAGTQPREVYYRAGDVVTRQSRPPGAPDLTPGTAPPANAAPWRSGTLYPGESWTHTFTERGAYVFESPYAAGFPGTPSTLGDQYGGVQGQRTRYTNAPVGQVAAGVITVEPATPAGAGNPPGGSN
jgi:plastocyanin